MKLNKIVEAYSGIQELMELKLPFKKSKSIAEIYFKMKKEIEFFQNENNKIINTYAKKNKDGTPSVQNNLIEFQNMDDKTMYLNEIEELKNMEIDFKFEKVELSEEDIENLKIKPMALVGLEEFISY